MQKQTKTKILIAFLFLVLLAVNFKFARAYHNPNPIIRGTNFNLTFNTSNTLCIKSDNTIKIEVTTGLWNSSNASSICVWNDRGVLKFTATNNSVLEISSPDAEEGFDISISGATSTSMLGNFTYRSIIQTGDSVTIMWSWRLESWIDKYTLFGIGMAGLIMMIVAPTWFALGYLKKGIGVDSIEQISWVFLFMIIGFGLFVSWLWW